MDKIKSLINHNLYGKSNKLIENFSFENDQRILAEEFDKIYEDIETIMEGPLANVFNAIGAGVKTYKNNRLIQKADSQIAKNLKKDAGRINAAIGVLASSLSKRINRLSELGKELEGKIAGRDPQVAQAINKALDSRILDATEFLNRVTAAKSRLAADTATDADKAFKLSQQASQEEQKAQQAAEKKQQATQEITQGTEEPAEEPVEEPEPQAPEAPEAPEASIGTTGQESEDWQQLSQKAQQADPGTKNEIKQQIEDILEREGKDLVLNILNKENITENNIVMEREYRGIINPKTIANILRKSGEERALKGFKNLSRTQKNSVAHRLEKAVMSQIADTPTGQNLLNAPAEKPTGEPDAETAPELEPEAQPEAKEELSVRQVLDRNGDKVRSMMRKAGLAGRSEGLKNSAIKTIVDLYNQTNSASETIEQFASDPKWQERLGNDARSIAIQTLDGIVNLQKEEEKPIVEELRRRLKKRN